MGQQLHLIPIPMDSDLNFPSFPHEMAITGLLKPESEPCKVWPRPGEEVL